MDQYIIIINIIVKCKIVIIKAKCFRIVILIVKCFKMVILIVKCFKMVVLIVKCFKMVILIVKCFKMVISIVKCFKMVIIIIIIARISLTLSRHFSLSFIASGRSSGLHPVSSHSCCMYVRAGCPAFVRPYVGVHRSTSLMSLSLLLQQCLACLVYLTWIVFVMGGRWPYSWCLVGCCHQDLFKIARSILV